MSRELDPDRFCANDGVETGIHVADGRDLCLDCFRAYKTQTAASQSTPAPVTPPVRAGQGELFGVRG